MPTNNRPLKVFLCHAHADRDAVRTLYTRLTNDGVDAWLDKENLLPGQNWSIEIRAAVEAADVVVVCHSKEFKKEGFRQREVRWALDAAMEKPEGEIFIIPARLEECEVIKSLSDWHWVDLFENNGYEMLMRALRARANNIGATLQLKKNWISNESLSDQVQKVNIKPQPLPQTHVRESDNEIKKPKQKFDVSKFFSLTTLVFSSFFIVILLAWKPFFQKVEQNFTSTSTSTLENTPTPIPLPTQITDAKGVSMALVPAGEFTMGRSAAENKEMPDHKVYLDAFYIDVYEVTYARYEICMNSGVCPETFILAGYPDFPVNTSWFESEAYCKFRGARLPTEAEWEKAARGIDDRTYPWGEDIDCSYANYWMCNDGPTKVGSYEKGKSPYGIYDMAGNVAEWVADWFSDTYYYSSPFTNPLGPKTGEQKVRRGGSWYFSEDSLRVSSRFGNDPNQSVDAFGFRCARDVPP